MSSSQPITIGDSRITFHHFILREVFLVTISLSGPVLRDTARLSQRYPPIARYGVFGVSTWPIRCDTPSPFSEGFPLGEHAKWRCDTPPQLSDTCAIPYLKRVLHDMGGYLALGR